MLTIEHLVKSFPGRRDVAQRVLAVDDVSLQVEQGQLFTLLGPSGCGKTTTLRSVAGLERPSEGLIVADDRTLFSSRDRIDVPANRRGLGMVFQSYAIWPHMKVVENVAFPLTVGPRRQRHARREVHDLVERVLTVVQLDHVADRQATDLSGGQQQRLALARALVMEPPLLLLDEPLSNLDAKLREAMRFELKRLQRDLGITAIYVTHDQAEALALSDRIAVMHAGVLKQTGTPQEIYNHPASRFVADFVGTSNFLDGYVEQRSGEDHVVRTTAGPLNVRSPADLSVGASVSVSVRPEHVRLLAQGTEAPGLPSWKGRVQTGAFQGDSIDYQVRVGDLTLRARCPATTTFEPDEDVAVSIDTAFCALVPSD